MAFGLPTSYSAFVNRTRTPSYTSGYTLRKPPAPYDPGYGTRIQAPGLVRWEMNQAAQLAGMSPAEYRATSVLEAGGTSGQSIRDYQRFLAGHGLYKGAIDGIWGPQTEAAAAAWQTKRAGLLEQQDAEIRRAIERKLIEQRAESIKARAELLRIAREASRDKALRAFAQSLRTFAGKSADDERNNLEVLAVRDQVRKQWAEIQKERNRKPGFWDRVGGVAKVLVPGLEALGYAGEQVQQAYYSGQYARNRGAGTGTQARAFLGGLPGLGFTATGNTRRYVEATNTRAEREALTRQGQLASFGEVVSGRAEDRLTGEALRRYQSGAGMLRTGRLPGAVEGPVSAGLDATFQVGTDPLSYVGRISKAAGLSRPLWRAAEKAGPGQLARTAARMEWLRTSATGRSLVRRVELAADKASTDATQLSKLIKGLSREHADEILRATSEDARREAIERVFASGEHPFNLALRKQGLIRLSGGRLGTGEFAREATLRHRGMEAIRRFARDDGPRATIETSRANVALERAVQGGLKRSGVLVDDFYDDAVAPVVDGLAISTRLGRLWEIAEKAPVAAFRQAAEDEVERLIALAKRAGMSADALVNATEFRPTLVGSAEDKAAQQAAADRAARVLRRLETTAALLSGDGPGMEQVAAELAQGFKFNTDLSGEQIGSRVAKTLGLGLPKNDTVPYSATESRLLRANIMVGLPDASDELREKLLASLDRIDASADAGAQVYFTKLRAIVDLFQSRPEALTEASRLADDLAESAKQALVPEQKLGLGKRAVRKLTGLPLAISEAAAANALEFQAATANDIWHAANRAEQTDRWMAALGVDDFSRARVREAAAAAKSEYQMLLVIKSEFRRQAARMGLDPSHADEILNEAQAALREGRVRYVSSEGTTANELMVLAQKGELIALPDPEDLRRAVLQVKAEGGDVVARVQNRLKNVGTGQIGSFTSRGKPVTVRSILKAGHHEWKFVVVTNFYAAPVGFAAGFLGSDDDASLGERLRSGFGAAALFGATAPVRYLLRLVGIEEGMRKFLTMGGKETLRGFVPAYAKWARVRGIDLPYRFQSGELVRSVSVPLEHLSRTSKLISTADREWVSLARRGGEGVRLGRKESRFVDAWFRILNHELHVETDVVAELLMRERAGQYTTAQVDEMLSKFLASDDGKVWLHRITRGFKAPGSADVAISRYREFINTYVPSADLALARLDGEVAHDVLRQSMKADVAPEFVHAQKTWVFPKNFKQAFELRNRLASQFVLEGPTTRFNRQPMAEWLYRNRFLELVEEGVDPAKAQRLADEHAVRRTNEVMFNINDESRFAKKVDFVFPFQQPREEMFRVWAKLIAQHPGRAVLVAENAAKAFNAGEDVGAFQKNPFTGQWETNVPFNGVVGDIFGSVVGFEANLKDYLFVGQGAYGVNFIPSPGGPYWAMASRTLLNTEGGAQLLEWMDQNAPWMREVLFPYGADGTVMSRGSDRLWMAYTHTAPPWEFASKAQMQNVIDKHTSEVVTHLIWQHRQKHPGDLDWVPTRDEIDKAVAASFKTWALMTNLNPAATRPRFIGEKQYRLALKAYKDPVTQKIDFQQMLKDRPELEPYVSRGGKTEWVGPDDWKTWSEGVEFDTARLLGYYKYKSGPETLAAIKQGREDSKAHAERVAIQNRADLTALEKEQLMWQWREKYPRLAREFRGHYLAQEELAQILHNAPAGTERDQAVNRWRQFHDVTPSEFKKMRSEILTGKFQFNPWAKARNMEDVAKFVNDQVRGKGFPEAVVVARLTPAEQVRWYNWQKLELLAHPPSQISGDSRALLEAYSALGAKQAAVFKQHQWSIGAKVKLMSPAEKALEKWRGDYRTAISDTYTEISRVSKVMKAAAERKDWKTYYALKPKRDALYDQVESLKNKQYREIPELAIMQEDVGSVLLFTGTSKSAANRVFKAVDDGDGPFIPSNEVEDFLRKPERIRQAYIQDLVDRLSSDWVDPNGYASGGGRLKWEYLTDFQKDLLEANAPHDWLEDFKSGTGRGGAGAESQGRGGGGRGGPGGELGYAYAMFKQYNKRPPGAKPPAAYATYLKLPNDPVIRADFVKKHPEVANWLKLGPMANMPPVVQMIVADIMIRNGKWEGEARTMQEITELAFAREQFARFNRRTGERPATYDIWVNMPTGQAKADYLKAHPEVEQWLKLGPMANMPEEYREVVRDIMQRYGEWTQRDDPLGNTISEYYRLPSFARDKFLQEHPELLAYWAATRDPAESAMFELADRYFAIQDVGAKRFFLQLHPELQGWFVDRRTKRYEQFLNRVAVYMGQNPEMFEHYLKRQEDVLTELLKRFAAPSFMAEVPRVQSSVPRPSTGESGRKRQVAA